MSRKWTPREDLLLRQLHAQVETGQMSWRDVAAKLPGRSPSASKSRWDRIQNDRLQEEESIADLIDRPTHQELFEAIRDFPQTLTAIANKFDRSPDAIKQKLYEMESEGYRLVVEEDESRFSIDTEAKPELDRPEISIDDISGREFKVAFISDVHSGSTHAQPSHLNRFLEYAYHEHDIRHVIHSGDVYAGIYGYRGQNEDIIPTCRPESKKKAHKATKNQIWLADQYHPKMEGMRYYVIGGNHDAWHIVQTGIDAVRQLCVQRDDMIYLGYDSAGLYLSDNIYVRLLHPSGGAAYAKSYKLQKYQEGMAIEALREAIKNEESPVTSMITMGHLHQSIFLPSEPILGIMPGAFEGQTNYLERKGLVPDLGGTIMTFGIDEDGKLNRTNYEFVRFDEIEHDWENWPVPEVEELDFDPEPVEVLFSFEGEPPE